MKQHSSFFQAVLLAACLSAAQAQAAQFSPGFLKLEVYLNAPGATVDDLRAFANYPALPDEVHYVPRFEIPPNKYITGNNGGTPEGERLSGFIVPAQTAKYVFYVSANVAGELWLSTNDSPANLQLIAQGHSNVPPRIYDTTTPSVPIPLVAGRRYYLEALQKSEAGKEESMAVTWTKDTDPSPQNGAAPISGQFLGILTDTDTTPPAAVTNLVVAKNLAGSTYLHLDWSAPIDPGNTNPVAYYDLRYSTQPISSNNWATATQVDTVFTFGMPVGTAQSLKVVSLAQSTTYYFAIRSMDVAGNASELSNIASGKTTTVINGLNVLWDLEFPVDGADPTINGDWINRGGDLPADSWAAMISNGVLTTTANFSPLLDTRPFYNFNTPWIVEAVCKCVDVVDPPDPGGFSGANFFNNMDTREDGYYSQFAFGLALLADGTQALSFNVDNALVATYPGLSPDFHDIRVEVDTTKQQFTVLIDSVKKGTNSYTRTMGKGNGNTAPYATVLGWTKVSQWKSVRIGLPAPSAPPMLQISRTTGNSLAISWPTAATSYTLQTTTNLSPASWSKAGDPTVQNGQNVFTTTTSGITQFYRLSQ